MTNDLPTNSDRCRNDDSEYACHGENIFKDHENKRYCVLHYPGKDKIGPFRTAMKKKLDAKDFNFTFVWFPEPVNFEDFEFTGEVSFAGATFCEHANFKRAKFLPKSKAVQAGMVSFNSAKFLADAGFKFAQFHVLASFDGTEFNADANLVKDGVNFVNAGFLAGASFTEAIFGADVQFNNANFGNADLTVKADSIANGDFKDAIFNASASFRGTSFRADAIFKRSTFKSYAYFTSTEPIKSKGYCPQFRFPSVQFEKPERVTFHTLNLHLGSFINADTRKFEFINVKFKYDLKEELKRLEQIGEHMPNRLLAITCRQLADNAETNHRYREASRLRYIAFEARRVEKFQGPYFWERKWWGKRKSYSKNSLKLAVTGFVPWRLDWWYWLASGYGERVWQAFLVFVLLFGLFTFGYKNAEFEPPSKTTSQPASNDLAPLPPSSIRLSWGEAARYSFSVATLQKPEPKPRGNWNWLVLAETVLGPAQAALLALAVRRRFMR